MSGDGQNPNDCEDADEPGSKPVRPKGRYTPKPLRGAVRPVEHMRKRADFLLARRGERRGGKWFVVEVLDRKLPDAPPRLGLTVTKKVGNAVTRNRIRRRLREAVRTDVARAMRPGHDYVIVGRVEVRDVAFTDLVAALHERIAPAIGDMPRKRSLRKPKRAAE